MTLSTELAQRIDDWMAEATASEPDVPDAMQLATVDERGRPTLRTVLLKEWDAAGLVFYTNYGSRKAQHLDATGVASVLLHWKSRERQLIVEGHVERVSPAQSDAYFASRARGSQIGAWASLQSHDLDDRETLVERVKAKEASFDGEPVPRPPNWGGYRLIPDRVEFWQGRADRLHVREVYERGDAGWGKKLLYP